MNRAILALLVVFVGGGLIAGFALVGGPGYARMEKFDRERAQDLRALVRYYSCGPSREETRSETGVCDGGNVPADLVDPVTDAPYLYRVIADGQFEICAEFQTETAHNRRFRDVHFDGATGCLRYRWDPDRADWVMVRP